MSRRQGPFVDHPPLSRPVAFRRALRQYLFRSFAMSPERIRQMLKYVFFWLLLIPAMATAEKVGPASELLPECTAPQTDPNAVHRCLFAMGDQVERDMVRAYLDAQAALAAFDQAFSRKADASASALLQSSQIAFEEYRKYHCAFPERLMLGGTAAINVTLGCRIDLTRSRIEQLQDYATAR